MICGITNFCTKSSSSISSYLNSHLQMGSTLGLINSYPSQRSRCTTLSLIKKKKRSRGIDEIPSCIFRHIYLNETNFVFYSPNTIVCATKPGRVFSCYSKSVLIIAFEKQYLTKISFYP